MRFSKVSSFLLFPLLTLSSFTQAESAKDAWFDLVASDKLKSSPAFAYVEDNPALPNVLIYGDSISMDYTERVRQELKGKADVFRLHCNGADSGSVIGRMKKLHDTMRDENLDKPWKFQWDIIHFNVGLHDLKYIAAGKLDTKNGTQVTSIEEYKKNLSNIVGYLKKLSPEAKLIFATTTPVPEKSTGRKAGDAKKYNEAALEELGKFPDIIINDLFAFTKPNQPKWWIRPGNVHFKKAGSNAQGTEVADVILEALADGEDD